jgi:Tfp pilus assembly protein PilO
MVEVEDKIIEVLKELERWEGRRAKVKSRLENDAADGSELERIDEQITHYRSLLQDMKKKLSPADVSRTIARSGNQ